MEGRLVILLETDFGKRKRYLAGKATVFGISATAEIDTVVGNYDLRYLKEQLKEKFHKTPGYLKEKTRIALGERWSAYTDGEINVHGEIISSDIQGFNAEDYCKTFMNAEFARYSANIITNTTDNEYQIIRYCNVLKAMCNFNKNEDIQSMLYLGMALPKKNNSSMDEGVLLHLFEYSQLAVQKNGSSVCFLRGDNFGQDKEELQQKLTCGEKIFVMSSYQTIGAGQNLQYKIPKGRKVVQLGEFTEGDKRFLYKDFDALHSTTYDGRSGTLYGIIWKFPSSEKKRRKIESGENAKHINFANREAKCYFDYYRLQIDCSGKLNFDSFCDADNDVSGEWEKICFAYDLIEGKQFRIKNKIDGLLYSDIDNIHAIIETREKTLPNISALMNMLQETDEKQKVHKDILIHAINEFELEYPDYSENVQLWKNILLEKEEIITKKEVKKVLNMRTNAASMFNRFLHEKFGIWIYGEWRKEEFDAIYQIGNLLNIKYEYNDNDYDDGHTFVYYVGAKSKRISYPNACCIRKVVSLGDKLEYEELLPLMAVEFVRNNQYTVLPFPYKYLREYIEQC